LAEFSNLNFAFSEQQRKADRHGVPASFVNDIYEAASSARRKRRYEAIESPNYQSQYRA